MIHKIQIWADAGDLMVGWYGSEETEVGDWWDAVLCPDTPENRYNVSQIVREYLCDTELDYDADDLIEVMF